MKLKVKGKSGKQKIKDRTKGKRAGKAQPMFVTDPVKSAELAGLQYVTDKIPGIRRKRAGKGFTYINVNGETIRDRRERQRLDSLAIPPAFTDVWICPLPNGHLQATGRDAKRRKQYRYHALWVQVRNQTKFSRMIAFSEALPLIRERVDKDLGQRGLTREKVMATVVRLMEITFIRIGNQEYAKTNRSFGLTTMRSRHVDISGSTIRFQFRGKSGVEHDIEVRDRRLAKIIKSCHDMTGYELFQYFDDDNQRQTVNSEDVNEYLQSITQQDFTAKDFRTWGGTVLAALELQEIGPFTSQTEAKKNVGQAIKNVAAQLGNKPATCRKYYVHPAITEAYLEEWLLPTLEPFLGKETDTPYDLQADERAVVAVLKRYLEEKQHEL